MINPFVSVVVTTKNEEKNIEHCLSSIRRQTYPQDKIKIIVVDNNSSDKTKEIARKYTKRVFNKGPERSAQRNYGIRKAKGEYILFLDADMRLSPKVIGECVGKFIKSESYKVHKENKLSTLGTLDLQTQGLVGLYIPERILGDSFWCRVRDFERSFYNATVIDCVRFFPKSTLGKVGGFDESLTGPEDWDFDKRMRKSGKTDIITSSLYHNEVYFNLNNYLKGKDYYSRSIEKYKDKWGEDDPEIKKQLGLYYRYLGVFIEKEQWRKLVQHPFLALGMYILRFLVGLKYLLVIKHV